MLCSSVVFPSVSIMEASNVMAALLLLLAPASASTIMCIDPMTGLKYPAGPMPSPEPCHRCVCSQEGEVGCNKVACYPRPRCLNPVNISGQCCPVCPTSVCQHPVTASPLPVGPISPLIDPTCDQDCRCGQDGGVECIKDPTCPFLLCPNPVRIPGKCCPVCPANGCLDPKTLIRHPFGPVPNGDACRQCFCYPVLGIQCTTTMCPYLPCDDPQNVPGKCCPVCPDSPCKVRNGNYLPVGPLPVQNDCQESCECQPTGEITCVDKQCPKPDCIVSIQLPGHCCPVCQNCTDPETGKTFPLGPMNTADLCQQCTCLPSLEIACRRLECSILDCDSPMDVPGECCKRCPDHACRDRKTREWLNVGPIPAPFICDENCMCNADGKITCDRKQCPETTCDEPLAMPDQCCPVCPDRCPSLESPGVWLLIGPVASSDPCQQNCRCGYDGLVRCDDVTCAAKPCSVPLVSMPGRCCLICPPTYSSLKEKMSLWMTDFDDK